MTYVFLADGFEEIEALSVVDILRRCQIEVQTVSITENKQVTGSHGIPVLADIVLTEADTDQAQALILPGGLPGSDNLQACKPLENALKKAAKEGKTDAVDNTIAQIIEKEETELADDLELVAVISAAIAAYEGSTSTEGFVVRSIKKSNKRSWKSTLN